jgi:hypothetical protein
MDGVMIHILRLPCKLTLIHSNVLIDQSKFDSDIKWGKHSGGGATTKMKDGPEKGL